MPVNPTGHVHVYSSPKLTQEAPFWQGFESQASARATLIMMMIIQQYAYFTLENTYQHRTSSQDSSRWSSHMWHHSSRLHHWRSQSSCCLVQHNRKHLGRTNSVLKEIVHILTLLALFPYFFKALPISQLVPVNPIGHVHVYVSPVPTQDAPFWQGLESHGSAKATSNL